MCVLVLFMLCRFCRVLEEVGVRLGKLVDLHFLLFFRQQTTSPGCGRKTYHFEGVELLLDLLGQHWRQPIASRNIASAVVIVAAPGIMKLDSWIEADVPGTAMGRAWQAPRAPIHHSIGVVEVVGTHTRRRERI